MDEIFSYLKSSPGPVVGIVSMAVSAILVFALFLYLGRGLALGVERVLARDGPSTSAAFTRRAIRWGFGLVGLVMALQILGLTAVATSLLATGGLLAVILGFAFREIGENLLAGVFLGLTRSFEVGDLVESSGYVGKVREIELRHVHLRAADGRDIFIPSAQIFRNVLVNYTRDGLRRGDFTVGVDYGDLLESVEDLLIRTAGGVPGVLEEPEVAVRVSGFTPQYAEFQVFFWVNTDLEPGLAVVRTRVMQKCLEALKDGGFTLSSSVTSGVELGLVNVAMEARPS